MSLDIYVTCGTCKRSVFSANITHNVSPMWSAAGVADALYESDGKRAGDLEPVLAEGLVAMLADPTRFEALNPANGWGDYGGAIEFLRDVLKAVRNFPDGTIEVSR